ncbi:MAG: DUF1156 domain-containing protein [Methanomicrobiales archaeon]|nr:DUF1156 domain-containing protein [Methanomicrobiales archaeon]
MPSQTITYPKRLIEVDLPIKKISEHARREKSIRHGHISTLHIWWARRPLAACRAVICASLWPDPADPLCPKEFIETARKVMDRFWNQQQVEKRELSKSLALRQALLDFIADFANWDNSTKEEYINPARELTQIAHESLGGVKGTRPLVVDPFAGGGSIPLEALRVGADSYGSDLNPVAVLLNKVVLEYIPKHGKELAEEIKKWGMWVKAEAEKELAEFYPNNSDGSIPIAYLWARTIKCEGPGCGVEIPLLRTLWLSKPKGNKNKVALKITPNIKENRIEFDIIKGESLDNVGKGTVNRGSATCPCCGYTTPVISVREQLRKKHGGTNDARLFCVVSSSPGEQGKTYRLPTENDLKIVNNAKNELARIIKDNKTGFSLIPDELLPPKGTLGFRVQGYGIEKWYEIFSDRQLLSLITLVKKVHEASNLSQNPVVNDILSIAINRQADYLSSLVVWANSGEFIAHTFGRQALPMVWEWPECNLWAETSGNWEGAIGWIYRFIEECSINYPIIGKSCQGKAQSIDLKDDSAQAFITDPPYYDSVPYADLSDFFYVWFKRSNKSNLFLDNLTPKIDEAIVDPSKRKDKVFFETNIGYALTEGRRIIAPGSIGVVVFAHKDTIGWESLLQAMLNSGWIITGSWPIDTERPGRLRSQKSAALASSIHLVCRPRENPDGSLREEVGDWREVLQELPGRIHEWMPRLAAEGVVGADAIFACLGPALEIFSRYSSVEKPNGEIVTLREYLEHVWAAVAKEALSMIFTGADTSGFEEDARLTAMWLWTLSTGGPVSSESDEDEDEDDESDEEESGSKKKVKGYILEYDAARKIAQGLGADLSSLPGLVEVKGEKARLLPVGERSTYLLGKSGTVVQAKGRKRKDKQVTLGGTSEDGSDVPQEVVEMGEVTPGKTTLDRIHQSMILFQAGRGEALKGFLLENAREPKFWKLAQSLSALYPPGTEEKRWVDGVLARKKGLGL